MSNRTSTVERVKGAAVFGLGLGVIILTLFADSLLGRPCLFGTKALVAFACGGVACVNGIRIYRR